MAPDKNPYKKFRSIKVNVYSLDVLPAWFENWAHHMLMSRDAPDFWKPHGKGFQGLL